jgi:hypothetical protein
MIYYAEVRLGFHNMLCHHHISTILHCYIEMRAAYALKWKGMKGRRRVRPRWAAYSLGVLKLLVITPSFWKYEHVISCCWSLLFTFLK